MYPVRLGRLASCVGTSDGGAAGGPDGPSVPGPGAGDVSPRALATSLSRQLGLLPDRLRRGGPEAGAAESANSGPPTVGRSRIGRVGGASLAFCRRSAASSSR